jgi:hypothetical protein
MRIIGIGVLSLSAAATPAAAIEFSGELGTQFQYFPQTRVNGEGSSTNASLRLEPEWHHAWDDGSTLTVRPYGRLDQRDDARTHADLREFVWIKPGDRWELRAGITRVFWGVTESSHLVDIINQTDGVEDFDGEDKLGQPLMRLSLERDVGNVDFYLLPYFRERAFPNPDGRLGPTLEVSDTARYESAAEQHHLDTAVRFAGSWGPYDVGLAHFYGTSRAPDMVLRDDGAQPILEAYYPIVHQTSVDAQATLEQWLLKFEGVTEYRSNKRGSAFVAGFEYTWVGIAESATDLGLLAEYGFDDRSNGAGNPLGDYAVWGGRWVWNDEDSTEMLVGLVVDDEFTLRAANLEASRRLNDEFKLSLDARLFTHIEPDETLYAISRDDHVQIELNYFF